jgi:hypothetical protein
VARAAEGGPRDVATTQIRTVPVKLFGGIADGYTVELAGLASEIAVYVDDVQVHAVDARLAVHESPALATSLYRLVNPTGPEEPRYVAPTI